MNETGEKSNASTQHTRPARRSLGSFCLVGTVILEHLLPSSCSKMIYHPVSILSRERGKRGITQRLQTVLLLPSLWPVVSNIAIFTGERGSGKCPSLGLLLLPGFPIPGILQARTLEWVAISFSNAGKGKVKVKSLSRVLLFATHGLQPTRLLRPWDFPGKSAREGYHCLLQLDC